MKADAALKVIRQCPDLGPHVDRLEAIYPERQDVYHYLVRSIVFQQLAGKAASVIFGRFLDLFDGEMPRREVLAEQEIEHLRTAGLSNAKATYIREVARYFDKHDFVDGRWDDLEDKEVIKTLTEIKGVGEWTAQMVLIFALQRPDVFPVNDLGIQQAIMHLFGLDADMDKKTQRKEMEAISQRWRPYRSMATIYLYRYIDAVKAG